MRTADSVAGRPGKFEYQNRKCEYNRGGVACGSRILGGGGKVREALRERALHQAIRDEHLMKNINIRNGVGCATTYSSERQLMTTDANCEPAGRSEKFDFNMVKKLEVRPQPNNNVKQTGDELTARRSLMQLEAREPEAERGKMYVVNHRATETRRKMCGVITDRGSGAAVRSVRDVKGSGCGEELILEKFCGQEFDVTLETVCHAAYITTWENFIFSYADYQMAILISNLARLIRNQPVAEQDSRKITQTTSAVGGQVPEI
ncbi:hypothetical protein BY996DRAFT_6567366 [Phakopsora pachyrhizi]|nr:hypothetical protein BY996DRAFT_6567366 [Phakopsora pachyrhizi]